MLYYPTPSLRQKEGGIKGYTIKVNAETEGVEEATSQLEDLKDAIAAYPRTVIKSPRNCTITINETETKQETEKDPNKMIEEIRAFSKMCNETESCDACSFKDFCEKAGSRFVPYEWNL
jgi:hypothetical protein